MTDATFDLPDDFDEQVRLFPLPDFVAFPSNVLPLHLFESRYREMLEDAIQGDQLTRQPSNACCQAFSALERLMDTSQEVAQALFFDHRFLEQYDAYDPRASRPDLVRTQIMGLQPSQYGRPLLVQEAEVQQSASRERMLK